MPQTRTLRIGTRKSALALAQAEMVKSLLSNIYPDFAFELVPMLTTGDIRTDRNLSEIGGKGLFTKELEESLADGRIDMAVHSLKDMETQPKAGFVIAATLARADARDALIAPEVKTLFELRPGARVGTSSLRRTALLHILRPDLVIVPFRGNVNTRLEKLARGEVDATLLAVAGLERLGKEEVITERLDSMQFIPAVGQGTIAVECRSDAVMLRDMLQAINHSETWIASAAERSLLARLDGSCRTPIAAYATMKGGVLRLQALIAKPDGSRHVRAEITGDPTQAAELGIELAETLLEQGGAECLA